MTNRFTIYSNCTKMSHGGAQNDKCLLVRWMVEGKLCLPNCVGSVLQCVGVCCSAICRNMVLRYGAVWCDVLPCVALWCSVLQRIWRGKLCIPKRLGHAVRCNMLQCVAVPKRLGCRACLRLPAHSMSCSEWTCCALQYDPVRCSVT